MTFIDKIVAFLLCVLCIPVFTFVFIVLIQTFQNRNSKQKNK